VFVKVLMKQEENVTAYPNGKLIHNYFTRHRLHVYVYARGPCRHTAWRPSEYAINVAGPIVMTIADVLEANRTVEKTLVR
jgi:hypothetical protein